MSIPRALCLLLLGSPLLAQAPAATPPAEPKPAVAAVDCRQTVPVPAELKILEEATLCTDGALATGSPNQLARQRAGYTALSESGSGLSTRTGMNDLEADAANGLRVYGFRLNPKESLKLKLQAEHNKIMMRFLAPTRVDATVQDIRRANVPPTAVRRSMISVVNTTGAPADYALMLYGSAGHKYKLDIERTGGN
jgi:hypothetical protein